MKSSYEMQELLPIVAELSAKYTSNESTSITYEKARQLMGAVQYAIMAYEQSAEGIYGLMLEKKPDAKAAYEMGYGILCEKIRVLQEKYNQMILDFRFFENENYRDTVEKGIPAFFLYYDPKFAPADTIITMDYPVAGRPKYRQGIFAVEEYVYKIELEQKFFQKLPEDFCYQALENYHAGYRKQFDNLCIIILKELLVWTKCSLHELVEKEFNGNQRLEEYLHCCLNG